LYLSDRVKQVLTEPTVAYGSVVSLHIAILLWIARLDKLQSDFVLIGPLFEGMADEFWTIVATNPLWLSPPFDNLVQSTNDPL